jgi:hypothetical protein
MFFLEVLLLQVGEFMGAARRYMIVRNVFDVSGLADQGIIKVSKYGFGILPAILRCLLDQQSE